jgi:hypothetical protein
MKKLKDVLRKSTEKIKLNSDFKNSEINSIEIDMGIDDDNTISTEGRSKIQFF